MEVTGVAIYIMLSTLTESGAETLLKNPARIKEVNREIEGMGVKVVQQYAGLGAAFGSAPWRPSLSIASSAGCRRSSGPLLPAPRPRAQIDPAFAGVGVCCGRPRPLPWE